MTFSNRFRVRSGLLRMVLDQRLVKDGATVGSAGFRTRIRNIREWEPADSRVIMAGFEEGLGWFRYKIWTE